MLNNLNSTIITPLSPKNQKSINSKIINNEFYNEISPEFLSKTTNEFISSKNQNNDASNFLLFTPADIFHNNISVTATLPEAAKSVYSSTTSSDIENSNFFNFSSRTDTINKTNFNNSYNNSSLFDILNNNIESSSFENSNISIYNLYDDKKKRGNNIEITDKEENDLNINLKNIINYNLIPNNMNNVYKSENNTIKLTENIFENDNKRIISNNKNLLTSPLSSNQNNLNKNSTVTAISNTSNYNNINNNSSFGSTENVIDSSYNRKRKFESYENVNEMIESETFSFKNKLIEKNNLTLVNKKIKLKNICKKTYQLLNKIDDSFINNKLNNNFNIDNSKNNKELNKVLIKNDENEVYTKQNNYSKEHLSFELNNNNISKKENKCKILLPNMNMVTKSYNNDNNNKINQLNITDNLNKVKIIDAKNITKNESVEKVKLKKNIEKKTKLVIKISKKMLKQHDRFNNDRKNVVSSKIKISKNNINELVLPSKLKSLITMSRSQYSYISDNDSNTSVLHTPKESRQIKNIAEQIYNLNSMYRYTDETLYLTMNYIYRYTRSLNRIQSKMLELIVLTSMYIAGKFNEELNEPTITDIISSSTSIIKMSDIKKMERKILAKLNWNLYITSPQSILIEYMNYLKKTTGLAKPIEKYISSFRAFNYIINNNFAEFIYPVYILAFSELLILPASFNINKNSIIEFLSLNENEIKQLNDCIHLLFEKVKERKFKKISIRNYCICENCIKKYKK